MSVIVNWVSTSWYLLPVVKGYTIVYLSHTDSLINSAQQFTKSIRKTAIVEISHLQCHGKEKKIAVQTSINNQIKLFQH